MEPVSFFGGIAFLLVLGVVSTPIFAVYYIAWGINREQQQRKRFMKEHNVLTIEQKRRKDRRDAKNEPDYEREFFEAEKEAKRGGCLT